MNKKELMVFFGNIEVDRCEEINDGDFLIFLTGLEIFAFGIKSSQKNLISFVTKNKKLNGIYKLIVDESDRIFLEESEAKDYSFKIVVFPVADHGIIEFVPKDSRIIPCCIYGNLKTGKTFAFTVVSVETVGVKIYNCQQKREVYSKFGGEVKMEESFKLSLKYLVFLSYGDEFDVYQCGPFFVWDYRKDRREKRLPSIDRAIVMTTVADFTREVKIFDETAATKPKYELVTQKFFIRPDGTFLASFEDYAMKEENNVFYFIGVRKIEF